MAAAQLTQNEVRDEAFDKLKEEFQLDDKVRAWLTSETGLAARNLGDFLHAASSEAEVKALVDASGADNKLLATSRLRQAWVSLKRARDQDEVIQRRGADEADLDQLLAQPVLDDLEARFWARYHMSYPPDVAPADLVVSRACRELEKRLLSVRDVLKVRTQSQQQRTMPKRARLSEGIEVVTGEPEDMEAAHTSASYLHCLHTLLVAYAKAGTKALGAAPPADARGCESWKAVECPLDVLMRYYFRVQERASRPGVSFHWVRSRDEAERAVWVDRMRNSADPMGLIVHSTFVSREAMWEPPAPGATPPPPPAPGGNGQGKGAGKDAAKKGIKFAKTLRDGTPVCQAFQNGKCQNSQCKARHVCAVIKPGGQVCGLRHAGKDHR